MRDRNLDNEALDGIGKKLVHTGAVNEADLDRLIANPELFSLVNKRVARVAQESASHSTLFLFIRQNALAFAGAAILLIVVVGVASLLRPEPSPLAQKESRVSAAKQPDVVVGSPVIPPQGTNETGKLSAGDLDGDEEQSSFKVENAIHRPQNRNNKRRNIEPVPDTGGDFYPVSYSGDKADTAAGGRIIRVELKRSSLFALGVNLPLENDISETVTADLLVGKDGVTRGVRIVN